MFRFDGEKWKEVPSIPGMLASSLGRIKVRKATFGVLDKSKNRFKYWFRGRNLRISVLICEAFHGPKPFAAAVVIHRNEDGLDNRPENLKWGTQKENLNCPGFISYCKSRTGENSPYRKGMRHGL